MNWSTIARCSAVRRDHRLDFSNHGTNRADTKLTFSSVETTMPPFSSPSAFRCFGDAQAPIGRHSDWLAIVTHR
jgi:hypothetical protein